MTTFKYNDGGRAKAGHHGKTGDCQVRAVAIATGLPYNIAYALLAPYQYENDQAMGGYKEVLTSLGWTRHPGRHKGKTTHLTAGELPSGTIVAQVSQHVCAVKNGVIHDIYDPSRDGTRMVYAYWTPPRLNAPEVQATKIRLIAQAIKIAEESLALMRDFQAELTADMGDAVIR